MVQASRCLFFVLAAALLASAQQRVVVGGPPPEIRGQIEALVQAYNSGSADEWERFSQAHFSPAALAQRTAEQRKQMLERMHGDFGATISVSRVERQGPEAPLRVYLKGATALEGVLQLELDPESPFHIRSFAIQVGGPDAEESAPNVPRPPVNGKMSDTELGSALDVYFQKLTADDIFSGVVLVARDGKPIYHKAYGMADRANRRPNMPDTRFNLGSINKRFTQTAIQQLVTRGKLSLSDTVGALLPDYPQELTRSATVDQLLRHTGGVADFFGEEFSRTAKDRFRANADYYRFVSSQKPLFAPGARNQYCNGCYIVLGAIIERASGMPYEKYIEDNIFKPAGMTSSGAFQSDGIVPNLAIGYTRRGGDGRLRSNVYMHGATGSAAGGGYSTASDLLAFCKALQDGRVPDVARSTEGMAIAGGAPGISSVVESSGPWTVIVLTNLDPRTGEDIGVALGRALSR